MFHILAVLYAKRNNMARFACRAIPPRHECRGLSRRLVKLKSELKVPFDAKGNMLHYQRDMRAVEWRNNDPVDMTIRFDYILKGRSSVQGWFKDKAGRAYPMFLADFQSIIPHLTDGQVTGTFQVVKRGSNYGLVLLRKAGLLELMALAAAEDEEEPATPSGASGSAQGSSAP